MERILITGGTGTVGQAFIDGYKDVYTFAVMSRNETNICEFERKYRGIRAYVGDVCNINDVRRVYAAFMPDIVIHAAAMKHINIAEKEPAKAVDNNIIGTMNVIAVSKQYKVAVTVGISSDKACNTNSVYGMTKKLMEKLFFEAHTQRTKFVCTRFANVAGSSGSVIPFFLDKVARGEKLPVTDINMNRLMISKEDAAFLIYKAISLCRSCITPLIVCKLSKAVNIGLLARCISNDIEYVGPREGESLNEILIRKDEIPYTFIVGGSIDDIACIGAAKVSPRFKSSNFMLQKEYSSETAVYLSPTQINELIAESI